MRRKDKGVKRKNQKANIYEEAKSNLERKYEAGKGRSKHRDKSQNGGKVPMEYIYMITTLHLYVRILKSYRAYLEKYRLRYYSLQHMALYLQSYVYYLDDIGYSAWTIKTYVSSLKKALDIKGHIWTPTRHRINTRRSREHANARYLREKSKKYKRHILFCICTGLRKYKELACVRGTDLLYYGSTPYLFVPKGKAGQAREVQIIGTQAEIQCVVKMCEDAGEDLVFPGIPRDLDVHALRAIYACRVYLHAARNLDMVERENLYVFRNDMGGLVTDKVAMWIASEYLGHHRISVIATSYMWALDFVRSADFSWLAD